ncbi:MAG: histidine phosphatase family protein [Bdellovibrio sp.]|nr:histidine phosphatase family protein [Bdellovibrio sp.]
MKFVLFRHAQKGLTPYHDPELTSEGHHQASALSALIKQNLLPVPTHLWASPKIRTTQTFKSIGDEFKVRIQISDLLDQREGHESLEIFCHRVQSLLQSFEGNASDEIHFFCTHYDWIEEAMTLINSDKDLNSFEFSHWPPAQFIIFEIQNGLWKFIRKGTPTVHKGHEL